MKIYRSFTLVFLFILFLLSCGGGGGGSGGDSRAPKISNLIYSPAVILGKPGSIELINGAFDFVCHAGYLNEVHITTYFEDGSVAWTAVTPVDAPGIMEGTAGGTLTVELVEDGNYFFDVFVMDTKGNQSNTLSGGFTVHFSWQEQVNLDTKTGFDTVAYGNGVFLAGDTGSGLYRSSSGSSWEALPVMWPLGSSVEHLAFGNGVFLGVVNAVSPPINKYGIVVSSDQGDTWATATGDLFDDVQQLVFTNESFYLVDGTKVFVSTDNGATWSEILNWSGGFSPALWSLAYGDGTLVVVGVAGKILVSDDNGTSWNEPASGVNTLLTAVAYGEGKFVALTVLGDIVVSEDNGATWTITEWPPEPGIVLHHSPPNAPRFMEMVYEDGAFIAVGTTFYGDEEGFTLASPDGINWTTEIVGDDWLRDVAFGNDTFVAVGTGGLILQSDLGYAR